MRRLSMIVLGFTLLIGVVQAQTTMLDVVGSYDDLSVLAQMIEAGDPALRDLLARRGNYTLLAPTDEAFQAFARFIDTDLDTLLASPRIVTDLIAYHLVVGRIYTADIRTTYDGDVVPTLLPNTFINFDIEDESGAYLINDVITVQIADWDTSNGVLHVIDDVAFTRLLIDRITAGALDDAPNTLDRARIPASERQLDAPTAIRDNPRIDDVLAQDDRFSLLIEALRHADPQAINRLGSVGDYTFFAPTDDVFDRLLRQLDLNHITQLDPRILADALLYHTLDERLSLSQLQARPRGEYISLFDRRALVTRQLTSDVLTLNSEVRVTDGDIAADNGVIHVVDGLLIDTGRFDN